MKTPFLVLVVAMLHIVAVGAFLFIQGCGVTTPGPVDVGQPEPPPMPPSKVTKAKLPVRPSGSTGGTSRTGAPPPFGTANTYTVKPGDIGGRIARTHGVTWREIAGVNGFSEKTVLKVGQVLKLPPHAKGGTPAGAAPTRASKPSPAGSSGFKASPALSGDVYTVRTGDNLTKIAKRAGVSLSALMAANGLSKDSIIRVNQKLMLPGGAVPVSVAKPPSIAKTPPKRPTPPKKIAIPDVDKVTIASTDTPRPGGLRLIDDPEPLKKIPDATDPELTTGAAAETFTYTVLVGETYEDIAQKFGVLKSDIIRMNKLSATAEAKAGEIIEIPPLTF